MLIVLNVAVDIPAISRLDSKPAILTEYNIQK